MIAKSDHGVFFVDRLKYIGIIATIFSASGTFGSYIYRFLEMRVFHSWVKASPTVAPILISGLLFFLLLLVFITIGFLLDHRARLLIQRLSERKKSEREKELAEKHRKNRVRIGRWLEKQCEVLVRLYIRTLVREISIELNYLEKCSNAGRKYSPIGLDHLANSFRTARDSCPICNLHEFPEVTTALQSDPEGRAIRELSMAITQSFDKIYQLLVEAGDRKEPCLQKVHALIEDVTHHIKQTKGIATDLQRV